MVVSALAGESRREFVQSSAVAAGALTAGLSTVASVPLPAEAAKIKAWQQIQLPVATTLYDIAFDSAEPNHGFVVGAKGTFLEVSSSSCLLSR